MKDQKKSIESQKNVNHSVFFAIKKARINVLFYKMNLAERMGGMAVQFGFQVP